MLHIAVLTSFAYIASLVAFRRALPAQARATMVGMQNNESVAVEEMRPADEDFLQLAPPIELDSKNDGYITIFVLW